MTVEHSTVSLADKVAFLSDPESYPGEVDAVEAIETHMAWVFLAGTRAYKMKKPVERDFLDYSTLERRRQACRDEVRLNRRLAPDIYLGTLPVQGAGPGGLRIGGTGTPVEWLVVMRRLRRDRMLDQVIRAGEATPEAVLPVARLLAGFFQAAIPEPLAPEAYVQALRGELEENRRELVERAPAVDEGRVVAVADALSGFLGSRRGILEARARGGRVVHGHGDLRPEHVFLGPPPAVIDCIEFNRTFRILDPLDELAFLDLDCARLGAPEIGGVFLRAHRDRSGDEGPPALSAFYGAHRALLRGKIAIWHLDDHVEDPDVWVARCARYLELAEERVAALDP